MLTVASKNSTELWDIIGETMEAVDIKIEETLLAILESVSLDEIGKLKDNPKVEQWVKRPWYNGKHYQRESFRSANEAAKDFHGNMEMPNQRRVFYINRESRFGLADIEIAYFANNIVLSTYETTPFFRNRDNLTWKKILRLIGKEKVMCILIRRNTILDAI